MLGSVPSTRSRASARPSSSGSRSPTIASMCRCPAAIPTTERRRTGTLVTVSPAPPQTATVPSARRADQKRSPPATAVDGVVPAGGVGAADPRVWTAPLRKRTVWKSAPGANAAVPATSAWAGRPATTRRPLGRISPEASCPAKIRAAVCPFSAVWPEVVSPQAQTRPVPSRAMLWRAPAAMATAFTRLVGTVHWPRELSPQASTRPSAVSARVWSEPAATETALVRSAGTVDWPSMSEPQATTVPSSRSATEWPSPPATSITLESPAGGRLWRKVSSPQATTVPERRKGRASGPNGRTLTVRFVLDWVLVDAPEVATNR